MYEGDMFATEGNQVFVIPPDPQAREDLNQIDRFTKEDVRLRHRLYNNSDWLCNTIAYTVVLSLVGILHTSIRDAGIQVLENGKRRLNFYDILEIEASNRKNEKAEKTGNIVPVFFPGLKADDIISDDVKREDRQVEYIEASAAYSYPDDPERTAAMLKIDKLARRILADKHQIILPKDYMAIAPTVIMLENTYRYLIDKLLATGKPQVTVNFNDLIEIHALKKGDGVVLTMTPGMVAKRSLKGDDLKEIVDQVDDE